MFAEREILIVLLKLTREGPVQKVELSRESRVPVQVITDVLMGDSRLGFLKLEQESFFVTPEQRLRVAVRAIELGADLERVCKFLTWAVFEDISVFAFESNGFSVRKHFRFSWDGRRWEIDILARKKPIVASVDCKHWHKSWRGAGSRKAAEKQIERTRVLAEAAEVMPDKIGVDQWRHAYFVPIILSLMPGAYKFHEGAPIVPMLQLQDFLQQMPVYINKLKHFYVTAEK